MAIITTQLIAGYIRTKIPDYHRWRLSRVTTLTLKKLIQRKNPYLFKVKNLTTAPELISSILQAYLSSQEETKFGDFLEKLACFISAENDQGRKSSAKGIDLEFERNETLYLVTIKSGPAWGNSSQIAKMLDNFRQAKRILGTNANPRHVVAVNGCCYGTEPSEDQGDYLKLCGQRFWAFLSGIDDLYVDIIEPFGFEAKERGLEFQEEYAKTTNRLTREFLADFCDMDGSIRWVDLVKFGSCAG